MNDDLKNNEKNKENTYLNANDLAKISDKKKKLMASKIDLEDLDVLGEFVKQTRELLDINPLDIQYKAVSYSNFFIRSLLCDRYNDGGVFFDDHEIYKKDWIIRAFAYKIFELEKRLKELEDKQMIGLFKE